VKKCLKNNTRIRELFHKNPKPSLVCDKETVYNEK
jgi:hypothetical protein